VFDIGFSELLVIAIVALVVLGPERLPKAARFAGLWVRRARNQWDSVKQELERELQAEDIKRQMQDVRQSMQDTETALRGSGEAARRQMQEIDAQHHALADEVRGTAPIESDASMPSPGPHATSTEPPVPVAAPPGDAPPPADVAPSPRENAP